MQKAFFTFLFLAIWGWSPLPTRANELSSSQEPAWQSELRPYLKRLPKDIFAYHWTTISRIGQKNGPEQNLEMAYVQKSLVAFEHMEKDSQQSAGPGLYLASDPAATQFYGGTRNWALLKLELGKGANYLDLKDAGLHPFSAQALEELKTGFCHPYDALELFNQANCRPFVLAARSHFSFDFITYTYTTTQFRGMGARQEQSILLSGSDKIKWEHSQIFTSETRNQIRERAIIRKAIANSIENRENPLKLHDERIEKDLFLKRILPYPDTPKLNQAEFIRYVRAHFLN